ncbi:YtxH domain-containing protein [Candidatus Nitrospira bockiana]
MYNEYEGNDYTAWSAFLAGAFIGAGIALLFAPQTGSELRGMLRSYANRAKDEVVERGREAWDTAVERGKEYMDTGRETIQQAGRAVRETVQRGQETVKEAGREAMNRG